MEYNIDTKQWIADRTEVNICGEILKRELLALGATVIPAGSVMVFTKMSPRLIFQTLEDIPIDPHLRNQTLIAYEVGSAVTLNRVTIVDIFPTLRFRDCRMPTLDEFNAYNETTTV